MSKFFTLLAAFLAAPGSPPFGEHSDTWEICADLAYERAPEAPDCIAEYVAGELADVDGDESEASEDRA